MPPLATGRERISELRADSLDADAEFFCEYGQRDRTEPQLTPRAYLLRRGFSFSRPVTKAHEVPAAGGAGRSLVLAGTSRISAAGAIVTVSSTEKSSSAEADYSDGASKELRGSHWLCSQNPGQSPHKNTDALWRARRGALGEQILLQGQLSWLPGAP